MEDPWDEAIELASSSTTPRSSAVESGVWSPDLKGGYGVYQGKKFLKALKVGRGRSNEDAGFDPDELAKATAASLESSTSAGASGQAGGRKRKRLVLVVHGSDSQSQEQLGPELQDAVGEDGEGEEEEADEEEEEEKGPPPTPASPEP